jgi:hypothetical protein
MKRRFRLTEWFILLALPALLLISCTTPIKRDDLAAWDVPGSATDELPLESGQIVATSSDNTLDTFVSLLPNVYNPYVHAAVLSVENGKPYIYEEFGFLWLNPFAKSPTDTVSGRVKRVPLYEFLHRYAHIEIWDPVDLDKTAITDFARYHYQQKTPFDPYFDHYETDRLYCTEFVALALEAGGSKPIPVIPNRDNRSARIVLDWLRVPEGLIQANSLVTSGKKVATLSATRTLTEIQVMDEVRHEFYRRFTCDQQVGNLFAVSGPTVRLRAPADLFIEEALALFDRDEPPPDKAFIRTRVSRLAETHFGPFDPTVTCTNL